MCFLKAVFINLLLTYRPTWFVYLHFIQRARLSSNKYQMIRFLYSVLVIFSRVISWWVISIYRYGICQNGILRVCIYQIKCKVYWLLFKKLRVYGVSSFCIRIIKQKFSFIAYSLKSSSYQIFCTGFNFILPRIDLSSFFFKLEPVFLSNYF